MIANSDFVGYWGHIGRTSMRSRTGRWAASVVIAAALGCGAKVKPGLGVAGSKLEVKFDRAMVTADALGRDAVPGALRIRPEIAGRLRWLDARTLAFVPAEPLPGSTRFELEIPSGTKALDGLGLAKSVRWSFETERLRLRFGGAGEDPGAWGTPDQPIGLAFNQPVRARDIERQCAYLSDTGKQAAVVDSTGESEEARRSFRVIPHGPLALDTAWRFRCEAELTSTEGPLGLATTTAGSDAGAPGGELAFRTYGPFTATLANPRGSEISPDEASIVITFSNPLGKLTGPPPVKIEPAVEGVSRAGRRGGSTASA